MAWVWISLVILARLNTADDPHRGTDGRLTGLEALFSDAEGETRSLGRFFPVPLWKFLKGKIKPHLVPVSRVVINVKIVIFLIVKDGKKRRQLVAPFSFLLVANR